MANVSECIHRAGIPNKGKHRDILFLTFCVTHDKNIKDRFHYENEFEENIWNHDTRLKYKLAKPKGLKKMIKLYKNFVNSKLS